MIKILFSFLTICFSTTFSISPNFPTSHIKNVNKIMSYKNDNIFTDESSQDENIFAYTTPLSSLDGKNLSNNSIVIRSSSETVNV